MKRKNNSLTKIRKSHTSHRAPNAKWVVCALFGQPKKKNVDTFHVFRHRTLLHSGIVSLAAVCRRRFINTNKEKMSISNMCSINSVSNVKIHVRIQRSQHFHINLNFGEFGCLKLRFISNEKTNVAKRFDSTNPFTDISINKQDNFVERLFEIMTVAANVLLRLSWIRCGFVKSKI